MFENPDVAFVYRDNAYQMFILLSKQCDLKENVKCIFKECFELLPVGEILERERRKVMKENIYL